MHQKILNFNFLALLMLFLLTHFLTLKPDTSGVVAMIRQKNEQGLSLLYDAYGDAIYGMAFRILRKKEESEEVVQTTFLKAWNNIDSFDEGRATLFSWLAGIAKNAAIDTFRLKSFQREKEQLSFSASDYGLNHSPRIKGVDVAALLKNLPDKHKILMDKMFLEGYSQQEIADALSMPLGTVKTRLREGIQMLRAMLKHEKHLLYFLTAAL